MDSRYDPYAKQAAAPGPRSAAAAAHTLAARASVMHASAAYAPQAHAAPAFDATAYAPARPQPTVSDLAPPPEAGPPGIRLDGLALAALIIVVFLVLQSLLDRGGNHEIGAVDTTGEQTAGELVLPEVRPASAAPETAEAVDAPPAPILFADPSAIAYPYDDYWVTQGPHGYSYGHMAIDLAAGKGAAVKSPIHGQVTGNYIDQYGNTTLIIENDIYVVTLLHGDFSAQVGQEVALGDVVGTEGNNGYTTDMQGRSCRNRDCGYHSHLNVYSKVSQANVNPLEVLR